MENPTNKLTIIKDGITYLCQTYLSAADATPEGGRALKLLNNGVECYVGLSQIQNENATPLRVLVDDTVYYITTTGKESNPDVPDDDDYIKIVVPAKEHQTIRFSCNGTDTDVTTATGTKTFSVPVGAEYTITAIPEEGYNAGTISGVEPAGTISKEMDGITVNITDAAKKQLQVTIEPPAGVTITVNCNGTKHTSSFTGEYGDQIAFSFMTESGYSSNGTLLVNGSEKLPTVLTSELTVTVENALRLYTVTLNRGEHLETVYMVVDGSEIQSGAKVLEGKTLTVTAIAAAGYNEPTITFS